MFDEFTTYELIQVAFRVTPGHLLATWIATGPNVDAYTQDELREHVIEQLQCYKVTAADINAMRS